MSSQCFIEQYHDKPFPKTFVLIGLDQEDKLNTHLVAVRKEVLMEICAMVRKRGDSISPRKKPVSNYSRTEGKGNNFFYFNGIDFIWKHYHLGGLDQVHFLPVKKIKR